MIQIYTLCLYIKHKSTIIITVMYVYLLSYCNKVSTVPLSQINLALGRSHKILCFHSCGMMLKYINVNAKVNVKRTANLEASKAHSPQRQVNMMEICNLVNYQ